MATEDSDVDDETLLYVSLGGAVLALLGVALPWAEATAIIEVSRDGYQTPDGKVTALLLALSLVVGPLAWNRRGRGFVAAAGGLLAGLSAFYLFVPGAIVGDVASRLDGSQGQTVADVVDPGVGLILTLLGSLVMAGAAGVAFTRSRETDLATVTDSADDPDRPPSYADLDDERRAICAAVDARLDETSVLVDKDIKRLAFDEASLGHESEAAWWDEAEALLREHEEFEALDDRGRRWQAGE